MVRRKSLSTKQKVAIGAIVSIIVALIYQAPTWYELWKERPIVDISLGRGEGYPKDTLQKDGDHFYVNVLARNIGKSDGKAIIVATGTNVKVSFDRNAKMASDKQELPIVVRELEWGPISPPIYVFPSDVNTFSVNLSYYNANTEDFNLLRPSTLTYQKSGLDYVLIDAR